MRRTAQTIEEAKEARASSAKKKRKSESAENRTITGRQRLPEAARPYMFKPGQSGNPGGRPKNDLAKEIAQGVFEDDPELIRQAFRNALRKGNAYVFKELADRAYGKVREVIEHTGGITLTLEQIDARLLEITKGIRAS